jgi:predicted DNA-binding protein
MSYPMARQQDQTRVGRVISFWLRHELIDKLGRLAKARGVTRNRALSELIEQADET